MTHLASLDPQIARILLFVGGGIAGLCLIVGIVVLVKRMSEHTGSDLEKLLAGQAVLRRDDAANLFGVRSWGKAQVRGNGCLILTTECLAFRMWMPEKTLIIPAHRLKSASRATVFEGKAGPGMFQLEFAAIGGKEDAVAWSVDAPEAWIEAVEKVRAEAKTRQKG